MSAAEQQRRRALKRARRDLDRSAQAIAASGKRARAQHAPSTRSKQAKWHHEVAQQLQQRANNYAAMLARMRQIAAELARKEPAL